MEQLNEIKLVLRAKHFDGTCYLEPCNCAIAKAAREHFGVPVMEAVDKIIIGDGPGRLYYRHDDYLQYDFNKDFDFAQYHLNVAKNPEAELKTITLIPMPLK